jgi:hypothetical protein
MVHDKTLKQAQSNRLKRSLGFSRVQKQEKINTSTRNHHVNTAVQAGKKHILDSHLLFHKINITPASSVASA